MSGKAIEFANVSKRYGDVMALDGVNLSIEPGEICGFLGPNGAGKTTAIRLLFDLIRPSAGTLKVMGFDCQTQGIEARRNMSYLPGELRLYEDATGSELIELVGSMRSCNKRGYINHVCEVLSLDTSKKVGSYSKGNKQKLGLVLALVSRPAVIVLDEPTSGMDPLVQEEVAEILRTLGAAGHTVFFSSHTLSEVERLCHRVAILRNGRVVAVEEVGSLKARSLHQIEVSFADGVPEEILTISGVQVIHRDSNSIHLQVHSNLDATIKAIARHRIVDLRTEQPSLEDVFMAYYRGVEQPNQGRE